MKLHFMHGWGFDRSMWYPLAQLLSDIPSRFDDRGYFGGRGDALTHDPFILVTHSFGTMRALSELAPQCCGIVAINGFDRFCASADYPGVPARVLDRMLARLEREPQKTVADFRAKCGSHEAAPMIKGQALQTDLTALRNMDCRAACSQMAIPLISVQSADDQILPADLRAAALSTAPEALHLVQAEGGHCLPMSRPDVCAAHIRAMVEQLR